MNDESKPAQDPQPEAAEEAAEAPQPADPVRRWTLIITALIAALITWYLVADRHTPFTSQARARAFVVPIAPQVSGNVADVFVGNNQRVDAGAELFRIDDVQYSLAVAAAQADLEAALQELGAAEASVRTAEAAVTAAEANLVRNEKDANRLRRIADEDPGAISTRRLDVAEASLAAAQAAVLQSRSEVERARQQRGRAGQDNARVQAAEASLNRARLDLDRTRVRAPARGLVTDVRVDAGNFAAAGAPLMTFVAIEDLWIQADFRENNLGHVDPGDPVQIVLDVQPGRVFAGRVRSVGYGVSTGDEQLGVLPTVENDRDWLRAAQRFPVVIEFDEQVTRETLGLRVGAQATIMIHTGDSVILRMLGGFYMRLVALFSYAY
jgi:multidrug resistance efflux pump